MGQYWLPILTHKLGAWCGGLEHHLGGPRVWILLVGRLTLPFGFCLRGGVNLAAWVLLYWVVYFVVGVLLMWWSCLGDGGRDGVLLVNIGCQL